MSTTQAETSGMFDDDDLRPPAGHPQRFGSRWRLVGAGLSDVWRYGDLLLSAPSGRLLLRGPNGTGKTTALEALWPYLLDLNAQRLNAGKNRTTTLKSLMREGATGKRRIGYLWLTLAGPGSEGEWSYGVRLQYSESGPVKVVPFCVPGRPLRDVTLHGPGRVSLNVDEFTESIEAEGGQVFDGEDAYISNLAARVWSTRQTTVEDLAQRLRVVRNPSLLGDLSAAAAAEALRDALPTVNDDVVVATAEALAESEATRDAFHRDARDADALRDFAETWTAHATDVVRQAHERAVAAQREVHRADTDLRRRREQHAAKDREHEAAGTVERELSAEHSRLSARKTALERDPAFSAALDLATLRDARDAKAAHATAALGTARALAATEKERAQRRIDDLERLHRTLTDLTRDAAESEPEALPSHTSLTWTIRPRSVLRLGEDHLDPGPDVRVSCDLDTLRELGGTWNELARRHRTRAKDAELALADHARAVAPRLKARDEAQIVSRHAEAEADRTLQQQHAAERSAQDAAGDWCTDLREWLPDAHTEQLTALHAGAHADDDATTWGTEDLDALDPADPARVLQQSQAWRESVRQAAARRTATLTVAAAAEREKAHEAQAHSERLREEAAGLRSGKLLPLPRPSWVRDLHASRRTAAAPPTAPGETGRPPTGPTSPPDDDLLGSTLTWTSGVEDSETDLALLESALAASGLLGAGLDTTGAHSHDWAVYPAGPAILPATHTLAAVLDVDDEHPHAEVARAVLARIPLTDTAVPVTPPSPPGPPTQHAPPPVGLVIGRDGTFASGPTIGHAPGARGRSETPPLTHIGARQRRVAALARADHLDAEATALDVTAAGHRDQASAHERDTRRIQRIERGYPSPDPLQAREAARALATTTAAEARETATLRAGELVEAAEDAAAATHEWVERTRARHLPTTPPELTALATTAQGCADRLTTAADKLLNRFLPDVTLTLDRSGTPTARGTATSADPTTELTAAWGRAVTAHEKAKAAQEEYETLERAAGAGARAALDEHGQVSAALESLQTQLIPARQRTQELLIAVTTFATEVTNAERRLTDARPAAEGARSALLQLLEAPGVGDALAPAVPEAPGPGTTAPRPSGATTDDGLAVQASAATASSSEAGARPGAESGTERRWWSADPLRVVGEALRGRRTITVRTLRERYDEARAHLAGTWTLDPGDPVGGLDTYTLTHDDVTYHPLAAARRAARLRDRARAALDAAEEQALRDFIIGRLPAAVGLAWTHLHDWVRTVNRLMRSAAASSGVGVQVRVRLSDDLSSAAHTVYRLACTVADADRTGEQSRAVGQAITQLIAGADGDTMQERIAAAVDVRDWVEIHYEIDRGTGKPERWGTRTALSGGERRLVILAPMLAAVAAGYDALGPTGLRLAALDEVPAEVDERGREGLARFMAELDLDLIATSYLWDGAPGAWDGIDAHDLEAGSDGTVVAFEMLVRGLTELPGDGDRTAATPALAEDEQAAGT